MPLVQNPDQTISIQSEQPVTPDLPSIDFSNLSKPSQTASKGVDIDFDTLAGPAIDFDSLSTERAPVEPEKSDASLFDNILGGLATGVFTDSFTANMATIIESHAPTWINSRVNWTDEEGIEFQTPAEYAGVANDVWDAMSPEQRRRTLTKTSKQEMQDLTDADPDSTSFFISNIAGMLVDPTTAIPIIGQSKKARMAFGTGVGGADIAAFETAQEGAPTLSGLALGMGLGAFGGLITKAKAKTMGNPDPIKKQASKDKLEQFQKRLHSNMQTDKYSVPQALQKTMDDFKFDGAALDALKKDAGAWTQAQRERGVIDKYIEPVSEVMKAKSPRLWLKTQRMFNRINQDNRIYEKLADDFVRKDFKGLETGLARDVKKALITNNKKALNVALAKAPAGVAKNYGAYKKAMDELYDLAAQARKGKKTKVGKKLDVYMHRVIKDPKAFRKFVSDNNIIKREELDRLDTILKRELPDSPSDAAVSKVYSNYLAGFYDKAGIKITPSATKTRKLTAKHFDDHPELLDQFHDPMKATHSYIRQTVEDVHKKSLFGKKMVDKYGDEINEKLFSDIIAGEVKAGRMSNADVTEVKNILDLLFVQGAKTPDKAIQVFKDLSYASLLGNPLSAITQIGDIFIASAKYGFTSTMAGLAKSLGGRGFSPKEMGMMETMMEEFVSTGVTKKWLQGALRWGGFQSVDKLGKAVNMNAAFNKAAKEATTAKGVMKLQSKWSAAFGEDFPKLLDDLKNKRVTDRTKTFVFAELADVQPITLMEMPAAYLGSPNGRIFYMLRTFQLKFFNMLRQKSYYEMKRGNYTEGIKAGAALFSAFTLGGSSTDMFKNFMLGRDNYAPEILFDNAVKTTGIIDRYTLDKLTASSDPIAKVVEGMLPPVGYWSPEIVTIMKAAQGDFEDVPKEKLIKQIPIMGKLMENFLMGGMEEYNSRRWKERISGK